MNLPDVRGTLIENAALGAQSWFRCGGTADLLFQPADFEDLTDFLKQYPTDKPLMTLGGMANTIVRDGGIRGCVIQLGRNFSDVTIEGTKLIAGAGALNGTVASMAAKNGIGGLEFLSGIPGSVGGAVCMNAGAYGTEVRDVLAEAGAVDRSGHVDILTPESMKMGYRRSEIPCGAIVTHAIFEGVVEDHEIVRARLKEIKQQRNETQPIAEKTGGSTYANPSADELEAAGLPAGTRAWELVDKVGGRGFSIGGAQFSEKHCNFMINTGSATAADLEALGDEMIRRVQEQFGLTLRWEIKRIGEK